MTGLIVQLWLAMTNSSLTDSRRVELQSGRCPLAVAQLILTETEMEWSVGRSGSADTVTLWCIPNGLERST